jgi:predicted kinase
VAREVAAENLQAGMAVVIDGVNATHERRAAWQEVAVRTQAHLALLETAVSDAREHRRRVDERHSGTSGYVGPSWETIQRMTYDEWDDERYGPGLVVETSDSSAGLTATLGHIQSRRQR